MNENNYYQTFIAVADDCKAAEAKIPKQRGSKKTVAELQFQMLHDSPFVHRQEDVLFEVWLSRQGNLELGREEVASLREDFFAKPQACLRASPLPKTHGWGIIFDEEGKAALCAVESAEYKANASNQELCQLKALRSKRA